MTDCPAGEWRDRLPDLLHDRLSPSERREVEGHLRGCADCRAELALLRDLRATMAHSPSVDVARVSAAIPAYRAPATPPRRAWRGTGVRAAAVLFALAVGTSVVMLARHAGVRPTPQVATTTRRVSAPAESVVAVQRVAASHAPVQSTAAAPAIAAVERAPRAARELALASGATADLTDHELSALLRDIESLDAVPSVEVEGVSTATPLAPSLPRGKS